MGHNFSAFQHYNQSNLKTIIMGNFRQRKDEGYRPSDDTYENFQKRDNYSEPDYGTYGASNTGDFEEDRRGYSSFGGNYENPNQRNSSRHEEDWRRRGQSGGNFSGSNEDRDYDFGANRHRHGTTRFGQYTDRDYTGSDSYRNRDDRGYSGGSYGSGYRDRDYTHDDRNYRRDDRDYRDNPNNLGVGSNYAYNRGGFGSNFGGEYGHFGRGQEGKEYSNEFGGPSYSRERGWAWGNPGREYSSYSGRYDAAQEERWERDNRDWLDRAGDKVRSWFGDDDADRRLREDRFRERTHYQGRYQGMGPKGYQRSDSRIEEDINDRLSDDPWVDASEVEVKVTNCEVTLTGTVPDKYAKRRAEDIAETVGGVRHVENRLRVSNQHGNQAAGYRR